MVTPPRQTPKWKTFEALVATIHEALDGGYFVIEQDVRVAEQVAGVSHQVDVLLRPKSPIVGPILISCKASRDKVGIDHVREWADIVANTGASAGVIVSDAGFTQPAIDAARSSYRRVSLWRPRPLTLDDYGPDEKSPDGYIACVTLSLKILEPILQKDQFDLQITRIDGKSEGRTIGFDFSRETRSTWYLRDGRDAVIGNLWDLFVHAAEKPKGEGTQEVVIPADAHLVLEGVRFKCDSFRFGLMFKAHEVVVDLDITKTAFAYENVATGQRRVVPLPPEHLQMGEGSDPLTRVLATGDEA